MFKMKGKSTIRELKTKKEEGEAYEPWNRLCTKW